MSARLPAIALSIRQPWAWAILHAGKDIENRSWKTRYRGPVLIHAGKTMTMEDYDSCMDLVDKLLPLERSEKISRRADAANCGCGGIVGVMDIVDCVEESKSGWFFGRYGFVLRNARPLPFFRVRGNQGFFKVTMP